MSRRRTRWSPTPDPRVSTSVALHSTPEVEITPQTGLEPWSGVGDFLHQWSWVFALTYWGHPLSVCQRICPHIRPHWNLPLVLSYNIIVAMIDISRWCLWTKRDTDLCLAYLGCYSVSYVGPTPSAFLCLSCFYRVACTRSSHMWSFRNPSTLVQQNLPSLFQGL